MKNLSILKIAGSIQNFDISLNITLKSLCNISIFKLVLCGYDATYFSPIIVLVLSVILNQTPILFLRHPVLAITRYAFVRSLSKKFINGCGIAIVSVTPKKAKMAPFWEKGGILH